MATILASGGFTNTAGGTVTEATAALRYVRVTICNTDSAQHTYQVQVGTHYVKRNLVLVSGEDRTVGPFSLTAAETMVVTLIEAQSINFTGIRFVGES